MQAPVIVWFRRDLRLADQPALAAALAEGGPVLPLFVHAPGEDDPWAPGAASRWWLHRSLLALDAALRERGSRLILRRGTSAAALLDLARATGAAQVICTRVHEPFAAARDLETARALEGDGVTLRILPGNLLLDPDAARSSSGRPFRVFTAFYRACLEGFDAAAGSRTPATIPAPRRWPESATLDELDLDPRAPWTAGLEAAWTPGEAGARKRLRAALASAIAGYEEARDLPGQDATSRLSPHLHFGEISIAEAWRKVREAETTHAGAATFLRELGWREFGAHLLHHEPQTTDEPLDPRFALFPWRVDRAGFRAWTGGRTGYPIVDAGMRQLWATGWMHNRVRMVVASFLVKHLLLPWQAGARWFWDTLVDADLASNSMNWQWTAGCGADAAPYFRIFNPVLQGAKFDAEGAYVRRWVPELSALPSKWIHRPWEAPAAVLRDAQIALGADYPEPIVDHAAARERALAAFASIRRG